MVVLLLVAGLVLLLQTEDGPQRRHALHRTRALSRRTLQRGPVTQVRVHRQQPVPPASVRPRVVHRQARMPVPKVGRSGPATGSP
ncbi:hypothetical protein BJF82_14895 [Kytococcus sp. CUA-901]|nr:hypothetical protein BJF82_14895 [Kytococcus sp. CUA-901]